MRTPQSRGRTDLALLSLGHAVTDTYSNFLPGLIVFLTARLALSNTMVGVLATTASITGSMTQLLYGHLADRTGRALFVVIGPAAAALFMGILGSARTPAELVLLVALGGSGIACFHPQAAVAAGSGDVRRRGLDLALFVTAGSAGYAIGPLVATAAAQRFGLERTWVAALPGLLAALLLYLTIYPRLEAYRKASSVDAVPVREDGSPSASAREERSRDARPRLPATLVILWAIVALRAAVGTGFVTFMPLFLQRERAGGSAWQGSVAVSMFLLAGAAGGLVGGPLSDRLGRRRVLVVSLALSTPLLALLTHSSGYAFLALLVLSGLVLSSSAAVNVAMAQEIAPARQGTASAMVQGLAFGTGGLLAVLAGAIADRTSIAFVYQGLAFIPLLIVPLAMRLPETAGSG